MHLLSSSWVAYSWISHDSFAEHSDMERKKIADILTKPLRLGAILQVKSHPKLLVKTKLMDT